MLKKLSDLSSIEFLLIYVCILLLIFFSIEENKEINNKQMEYLIDIKKEIVSPTNKFSEYKKTLEKINFFLKDNKIIKSEYDKILKIYEAEKIENNIKKLNEIK